MHSTNCMYRTDTHCQALCESLCRFCTTMVFVFLCETNAATKQLHERRQVVRMFACTRSLCNIFVYAQYGCIPTYMRTHISTHPHLRILCRAGPHPVLYAPMQVCMVAVMFCSFHAKNASAIPPCAVPKILPHVMQGISACMTMHDRNSMHD